MFPADSFRPLIGQQVIEMGEDQEGIGFRFENGDSLSVLNRYVLQRPSSPKAGPQTLLRVVEDEPDILVLTFSDGTKVSVDLSDAGYIGPEAIVWYRAGGQIVVWRGEELASAC